VRRIDQQAACACVVFRNQRLDGHLGEGRIGKHLIAIVIGNLLCLYHQMQPIGSEQVHAMRFKRLDQIEHLDHRKALRRRRRVEDGDVAVAAGQRRAPGRLLSFKISRPKEAALRLREAHHFGGNRPVIEAGPPMACDGFKCPGQVGIDESRARRRHGTIRQENLRGFALPSEIVAHHLDEARKPLRNRKAFACIAHSGFEQAPQRQPAMCLMRGNPACDGTRHSQCGRDDPAQRDFAQPSSRHRRKRRARCRLAAAVEIPDLPAAAVMHEPERVAAKPRHVRIDDRKHGACRDRGVDRRSSGAKHVDAG
jgi:hypothetical protein